MKRIIFFDTLHAKFEANAMAAIGDITHSTVDQVDSWSALMGILCQDLRFGPVNPNSATVVIFNMSTLKFSGTTVNEIVDALTTISAISGPRKIMVGIVINDKCSQTFVKELKNSNINGIVPNYKEFGDADFFDAVNTLLSGSTHWPDSYIVPKIKSSTKATEKCGIRLTTRQHEIMTLVANRGLSNKKIAQILDISESTVKVHVSAVLKAYSVRNRTQLALAASTGRL